MVWFTVFFMVILKIPALYLAYVIWWAVKDPPTPETSGGGYAGGNGRPWRPPARKPSPGRHPGPHGAPLRRPSPSPAPVRAQRIA
jgi:hypothetical protein